MHFIVIKFVFVELSITKLFDNKFLSEINSDITNSLDFASHSHDTFLVFSLYPLYEHLFSHKDKLLSINSSFLSFNIISVPFSEVYGKHSFV